MKTRQIDDCLVFLCLLGCVNCLSFCQVQVPIAKVVQQTGNSHKREEKRQPNCVAKERKQQGECLNRIILDEGKILFEDTPEQFFHSNKNDRINKFLSTIE